jgi:hypothetical protein
MRGIIFKKVITKFYVVWSCLHRTDSAIDDSLNIHFCVCKVLSLDTHLYFFSFWISPECSVKKVQFPLNSWFLIRKSFLKSNQDRDVIASMWDFENPEIDDLPVFALRVCFYFDRFSVYHWKLCDRTGCKPRKMFHFLRNPDPISMPFFELYCINYDDSRHNE